MACVIMLIFYLASKCKRLLNQIKFEIWGGFK